MFGQPPSNYAVPTRCGICRTPKKKHSYSHTDPMKGIRTHEVHLCARCDLTPDPPTRS